MRSILLTLGLMLAATSLSAQVSVEVLLDEPEFLRDESMVVRVRILNRSGRTLHLGQSNDWLSFAIQDNAGAAVGQLAEPRVTGEFTMASSQTATKSVDIMPCFDFAGAGRYSVTATVRLRDWDGEVTSNPKYFHIIKGSRLWEADFGVPAEKGAPEVRRYSLVRANGLKQQRLYVRVTDAVEQQVFRVVPVGPMVSFGRPEAQVDGSGTLHLLFQNGPRSFLYGAFTPNGAWQSRLTFDYGATRPVLRVNDKGRIFVEGGVRRTTPTDLPRPEHAALPADPPAVPAVPSAAPGPIVTPKPKDDQPARP